MISVLLLLTILAGCAQPGGIGKQEQTVQEQAGDSETAGTPENAAVSTSTEAGSTGGTDGSLSGGDSSSGAGTDKSSAAEVTEPQEPLMTQEEKNEKMIRDYIQTLSLEDKASGLFIVTPEALSGYDVVTEADEQVRESLEEYPVAGLIFFAQNIVDKEQLQQMLASAKEWGSAYLNDTLDAGTGTTSDTAEDAQTAEQKGFAIPPFLSVDEEGGIVARIGSSAIEVPYVGSMAGVGATGDPEAAYEAGSTIGGYLQELGFNVDLAPDADVLVDPENVTIGERSFGSDPELCAGMVHRYVDGLHEHGIASCIKHFPGLGDTESDTHTGAAWSSRTLEDYRNTEFLSFKGGIDAGTEMVMVSHLSNSELSGSDLPASLNKTVITDLLRGELGFEGIVITDSLRMGAVTERFGSAEAAVTALDAGVDVLLMSSDFLSARQGIMDAVRDGRISEERIDESLFRIFSARAALAGAFQ